MALAVLKQLPVLEFVYLYLPLTDEAVSRLVELPKLMQITLYAPRGGQPPPDVGHAALAKHPGVEYLTLVAQSGSPTDAALLEFSQLPKLKLLGVSFGEGNEKRRYTTAWIPKFRELRPDVHLGVDGTDYPAKAPPFGFNH